MNQLPFAAAIAAAALLTTPALAENGTNCLLTAGTALETPSLEASFFYRSMKIERGMVENDEGVFGYEAEIEWNGLFGGVEACYDLTDLNGRKGRYNEIESFLGYGLALGDLSIRAAYVYKACGGDEPDTQQVEAELAYETPWVTPVAEFECDTKERPGALYGVLGLEREWPLTDWLAIAATGGVGLGNAYRNDAAFASGRFAFREIHVGAALEAEICPHVRIVPDVDLYDYFTSSQRHAYDKCNGFACAAGCHLAVDF